MNDKTTINFSDLNDLYDEYSTGGVSNLDSEDLDYSAMEDSVLDALATAAERTANYMHETAGISKYVDGPVGATNTGYTVAKVVKDAYNLSPAKFIVKAASTFTGIVLGRAVEKHQNKETMQNLAEITTRATLELQRRTEGADRNKNGIPDDDQTPQEPSKWQYDYTTGSMVDVGQTSNGEEPYSFDGGDHDFPGVSVGDVAAPSNGTNTNGGYNHSGSGVTTGDFVPQGGVWEGGNGNQNHGTPDPSLPRTTTALSCAHHQNSHITPA